MSACGTIPRFHTRQTRRYYDTPQDQVLECIPCRLFPSLSYNFLARFLHSSSLLTRSGIPFVLNMFSHLLLVLPALLVLLQVVYRIYSSFASPLGSIPGPFLARITKLWYFWHVSSGKFEEDNIALHRKYGKETQLPRLYASLTFQESSYAIVPTNTVSTTPMQRRSSMDMAPTSSNLTGIPAGVYLAHPLFSPSQTLKSMDSCAANTR